MPHVTQMDNFNGRNISTINFIGAQARKFEYCMYKTMGYTAQYVYVLFVISCDAVSGFA